jgi:hypothetical protein
MSQSSEQHTHEEDDRELSGESPEWLPLGEPYDAFGIISGGAIESEEISDDYLTDEDEREIAELSSGDFPLRFTTSEHSRHRKHLNDTKNGIGYPFQSLVSLKK